MTVAVADVKIDRADFHVANLDIARECAQPRHQRKQGAAPIVAHFTQPGIIDLAIDKEIGARRRTDGKQSHIGSARVGCLGVVGQCAEVEGGSTDRLEIKTDADGVTGTDDLALDPDIVPQSDIQAVCEHDQSGRDFLASR